uniref:Uncharacterized protein n=1 Tax=Anguilla anguilla TaxID=7936 RepID=A0A0E9SRS6_ANGAN
MFVIPQTVDIAAGLRCKCDPTVCSCQWWLP